MSYILLFNTRKSKVLYLGTHTKEHTQNHRQMDSQNRIQSGTDIHATDRQENGRHGEGGVENSNLGSLLVQ